MFLGAERKGVDIDSFIRAACVALERLDPAEVGAFALGEPILSIELELGDDDWVLSPAVHVQRCLGEDEGACIRDTGATVVGAGNVRHASGAGIVVGVRGGGIGRLWDGVASEVGLVVSVVVVATRPVPGEVIRHVFVHGTGVLEKSPGVDKGVIAAISEFRRTSKGVDRIGQSVDGVGVVEGLGAKHLVQGGVTEQGGTVVDVLIGLNNPDEFLDRVIEVKFNFVTGTTDGLIASELQLRNEVLVGILGEAATFIGIQKDIVDIQRSGNERLIVGDGSLDGLTAGELVLLKVLVGSAWRILRRVTAETRDCP